MADLVSPIRTGGEFERLLVSGDGCPWSAAIRTEAVLAWAHHHDGSVDAGTPSTPSAHARTKILSGRAAGRVRREEAAIEKGRRC